MVLVFGLTVAASFDAYEGNTITLLSAVTSTGAGSAQDLNHLISKSTCCVTWGGTTPTNTVVDIEGSIDNVTFDELATVTVTSSGTCFSIVNQPARHYRAEYVSKSGGGADTAVTVKCRAGGN